LAMTRPRSQWVCTSTTSRSRRHDWRLRVIAYARSPGESVGEIEGKPISVDARSGETEEIAV
jgi:hypothetical protein